MSEIVLLTLTSQLPFVIALQGSFAVEHCQHTVVPIEVDVNHAIVSSLRRY